MPTPLDDLRASYQQLCAKLAEVTANPKPTYSEKGRSVSWDQHRASILEQIKSLREIPGVDDGDDPGIMTVTAIR